MSTQPAALDDLIDQAQTLTESYTNGNITHVLEQLTDADPVLVVLFTAYLCEHFRVTAERGPLDVGTVTAIRLRARQHEAHHGR